jgi:hypothetical protein
MKKKIQEAPDYIINLVTVTLKFNLIAIYMLMTKKFHKKIKKIFKFKK